MNDLRLLLKAEVIPGVSITNVEDCKNWWGSVTIIGGRDHCWGCYDSRWILAVAHAAVATSWCFDCHCLVCDSCKWCDCFWDNCDYCLKMWVFDHGLRELWVEATWDLLGIVNVAGVAVFGWLELWPVLGAVIFLNSCEICLGLWPPLWAKTIFGSCDHFCDSCDHWWGRCDHCGWSCDHCWGLCPLLGLLWPMLGWLWPLLGHCFIISGSDHF